MFGDLVVAVDAMHKQLTFGMRVTRNRESGTLTISRTDRTRKVLGKYGRGKHKLVSTPAGGKELSLDQPKGRVCATTQRSNDIKQSEVHEYTWLE